MIIRLMLVLLLCFPGLVMTQVQVVPSGGGIIGTSSPCTETQSPVTDANLIWQCANGGGGSSETIPFTPAGNIEAENIQDALEELDVEKIGVDEDGEMADPEVVTGSFIFEGGGPPGAGTCPHSKAFYRDISAPGDTYTCLEFGGNWFLTDQNSDAITEIAGNTGSIVASGSANISIVGAGGLITSASGTTLTITPATKSRSTVLVDVAATHDDVPLGSFLNASTIASIWCRCSDVTGTLPTFTLSDGAGNAMTITGTNPTCTSYSATIGPAAVTAGNALVAGEMAMIDTTNTPTAGKTCEVGVSYAIN